MGTTNPHNATRTSCIRVIKLFTAIELLTVCSIIGILFSILLPSLQKAKEHAYQVSCASNLRQIALGYKCYMRDYNNKFPDVVAFLDDLSPTYAYTRSLRVYKCPSVKKTSPNIYPDRSTMKISDGLEVTQPDQLKASTSENGTTTQIDRPGMAYYYVSPGDIYDIDKNRGIGNDPYKFDVGNHKCLAFLAKYKPIKILYDKHYFIHFKKMNVVYIDDQHVELTDDCSNLLTLTKQGGRMVIDIESNPGSPNSDHPDIYYDAYLGPHEITL